MAANTPRVKKLRSLMRRAPSGKGTVCIVALRSKVRLSRTSSPLRWPRHRSSRTCSLSAAVPALQPGHHSAKAAGSVMVEESKSATARKRSSRGMATGSAAITVCTAHASRSSLNMAAASVNRSSSDCARIVTPTAAAPWASPSSDACGLASHPKTSVWAKKPP